MHSSLPSALSTVSQHFLSRLHILTLKKALNDDDSNPTAPPAIGLRPVESSDLTNYEQCLKRKGSHDEYLVAKRQQQQPDDFSTPPPMPDPFVHGYSGVNQSQSSG